MVQKETVEDYLQKKRWSTEAILKFQKGITMIEETQVLGLIEELHASIANSYPFVRIRSYRDLIKDDQYKEIARSMTVPPYSYPDLKSQVELTWGFETEDTNLLIHSVLVTANPKERTIVVSGDKVRVLQDEPGRTKDSWRSPEVLAQAIKEAFENPWKFKT